MAPQTESPERSLPDEFLDKVAVDYMLAFSKKESQRCAQFRHLYNLIEHLYSSEIQEVCGSASTPPEPEPDRE